MTALLIETISSVILYIIQEVGYFGILLLMTLQSANLPVPSEIVMPFAGFLAAEGIFNFWLVVLAGTLGSLLGALISYKLAAFLTKDRIRQKYAVLGILINDNSLAVAERWFRKYGHSSVFLARLIPIVNTFIAFPAGLAKMRILEFSVLTFAGAFIWSLFLTWLGFVFGENWPIIKQYFGAFDYLIVALIAVAIGWWLYSHFRNSKRK